MKILNASEYIKSNSVHVGIHFDEGRYCATVKDYDGKILSRKYGEDMLSAILSATDAAQGYDK